MLETLAPFDKADVAGVRAHYEKHGVVVVKLLGEAQCDDLILEQWQAVILKQPWVDPYRIRVRAADGRELDAHSAADRKDFLSAVKGPLSSQVLKSFEEGWPLHRGFGACCDPAVFHLPGVWGIRQDPALYGVASALCGRNDLWVDINRSIQKLPGQGESEFLHWDLNPFAPSKEQPKGSVCGKVCYSRSRFVAVCGTHTPEFHAKFAAQYKQHYPDVKAKAAKFGLDFKKPDPMGLIKMQREYEVPAGCMVLWSDKLLHGQVKTPKADPVEYGCYVGFFPAGSRAEYKAVCGVEELDDRLGSFREGRAPKLWPSFDPIHFYPKRFLNFGRLLESYIKKMPQGHLSVTVRQTTKGVTVPHLEPWRDPAYQPPHLTGLGRKLLGLELWPAGGDLGGRGGAGAGGRVGGGGGAEGAGNREGDGGVGEDARGGERVRGEGGGRARGAAGSAGGSGEREGDGARVREPGVGGAGGAGGAGGRAPCFYNKMRAALQQGSEATLRVLLVTKKQKGHGLRQDMRVYEEELRRRGVEVVSMELSRHTPSELAGLSGAKACERGAEDKELAERLAWCCAVVGFEFLGDSRAWGTLKEQRAARRARGGVLRVVLVPNLEYTKMSNEAACDTMQNLDSVDVIVAKSEDVYRRLHTLFLLRKFEHGSGALLLVPHTTMIRVPDLVEDASLRDSVIHFPGSSKDKNTVSNCMAALRLVQDFPALLKRLIIKCSHRQQALSGPGQKRKRAEEEVPACTVCRVDELRKNAPGVEIEYVDSELSEEEKAALYGRCRLAVCASKAEGFGHYILEAAAYGCQVVTTDGVPMRSILTRQVALAATTKASGAGRNLGLAYNVTQKSVEIAARTLLQGGSAQHYSPDECRRNLLDRISLFQEHMGHFICALRGTAGRAGRGLDCTCDRHKGDLELTRELCAACGEDMHAELRAVNAQTPDKAVFVCPSCESGRAAM